MFASITSALKSAIYEDPNAGKAAPAAAPQAQGMPVSGIAPQNLQNQAMVAEIKKATFSRNTAFTRVLQAADTLVDVVPDQTMRLKAAFKMAGAGQSGKQVADAVDVHLQDVDGEEMRFKQAIDQKTAQEVGALNAKASVLEQQVSAASAEIQAAQQRITELNTTIVTLSQQAGEAKTQAAQKTTELAAAQAQFKLSADAVRAELNAQKALVVSTLV